MASFLKASSKALLSLGMLAASMQGALGHIYLSSIYLGNEALPEGECVRGHPSTAYDSPIPLVNSADMTCGFLPYAGQATSRKCPIEAGSKMGLQWYHQSASPSDDIVDPTHQGPLMVYMVKTDAVLPTDGWFKVYEDGLTNGVWAVDKLIANRGRVDFTIPADIAPGNYLVRGEILALHGANALNGVQPYVGCVEVTISGNGKATPAGVKIPGVYSQTDAGMLFDKYSGDFKAGKVAYPIPGPAVYKSGSSSTPSTGSSTSPVTQKPVSTPPAAATTRPTGSASTSAPNTPAPATSAPSKPSTGGSIKVGLTANSNTWYLEAMVSADQTTVKVEMMDSGRVSNWFALTEKAYGFVFDNSIQVTFPVSLRLTSSTGKQVVLTNIITSLSSVNVDTGKSYAGNGGSSSSTSTSAPATSAPATVKPATSAPVTSKPATSAPANSAPANSAPSTGNGKVTIHSGASAWWFALTVDADVSKVEIKDNGAYSTFTALKENAWGGPVVYSFSTSGSSLIAPLTARITSKSGKVVTATISSITPDSVIQVGSL